MGDLTKAEILDRSQSYVCPGRVQTLALLGARPVMGERSGHYFRDLEGRQLFDVHINGGTFTLGHRHPELVETLKRAADRYDIGNHHLPSGPRALLAEQLAQRTPGRLRYSVLAASGGEAVDVAIRTARRATGRRRIVSIVGSFHGHTGLALAAGDVKSAEYFLSAGAPADFAQVPFNDLEAMETALRGRETAAVLIETIPATLGFPMPDPGYLPAVRSLCSRYDALYIADEVQTGLGRTGHLWAVEGYGVEPDILVTGKGLSGGVYPMAAAVLSEDVAGWIHDNGWGHVSTFGGSEIGCEVARKVLEIVTRPSVIEGAAEAARILTRGFSELRDKHSFLVEVRQSGLVIGLKLDHPLGGPIMTAACYESGIWAFFAGFDRSALQVKPDLLVDPGDCRELLERFDAALELGAAKAAEHASSTGSLHANVAPVRSSGDSADA